MARRSIEISRTAEKQLKKLNRDNQRRVVKAIVALAEDPRPQGSRKLAGYDDVFRIGISVLPENLWVLLCVAAAA